MAFVAEEEAAKEERKQKPVKEERKFENLLDDATKRIADLSIKIEDQAKKIEQMTKESPGTALTIAFIAGAFIGGLMALALSKK